MSDMSLLFLWWVAHKKEPGWDAGRPFLLWNPWSDEKSRLAWAKENDNYFIKAKELALPKLSTSYNLCNGLSVVNRTTFDHIHAWGQGKNFNWGLSPGDRGIPYILGPAQYAGGCPELPDNKTFTDSMANERLYFINVHYQGDLKKHIVYGDKLHAHSTLIFRLIPLTCVIFSF